MGLTVHIFRWDLGDCTSGGISGDRLDDGPVAKGLCIVNIPDGPFDPSADYPAALLVEGAMSGIARIVPARFDTAEGKWVSEHGWHMMGGNYAATSDSRFTAAVEKITGHRFYGAVPIHDRREI